MTHVVLQARISHCSQAYCGVDGPDEWVSHPGGGRGRQYQATATATATHALRMSASWIPCQAAKVRSPVEDRGIDEHRDRRREELLDR